MQEIFLRAATIRVVKASSRIPGRPDMDLTHCRPHASGKAGVVERIIDSAGMDACKVFNRLPLLIFNYLVSWMI